MKSENVKSNKAKRGLKLFKKLKNLCRSKDPKPVEKSSDFKILTNMECLPPSVNNSEIKEVRKWRERVEKTCKDFDSMNQTFHVENRHHKKKVRRSRDLNQTSHHVLFDLLHQNESFHSEISKMKLEIENLKREQEIIQRGMQTRQKLVTDQGYFTLSPRAKIYRSDRSDIFYGYV